MDDAITIRPFVESDLEPIARIYGHYVLNSTATFEESPPTFEELGRRMAELEAADLPILVACGEGGDVVGGVLGYAYARAYNPRPAYRFTVEDSIYVDPEHCNKGIGKSLLLSLIEACRFRQFKQIMAVIGDANNEGSLHLHRSCGFEVIGTAEGLGFKFDRWLDVVFMQYSINE